MNLIQIVLQIIYVITTSAMNALLQPIVVDLHPYAIKISVKLANLIQTVVLKIQIYLIVLTMEVVVNAVIIIIVEILRRASARLVIHVKAVNLILIANIWGRRLFATLK